MKKNIISIQEIERNNRVKELMSNRVERKKQQPLKLTQEEMFEVKAFMKEGISRSEAVNLVLEKNKLLNVKTNERTHLNNWKILRHQIDMSIQDEEYERVDIMNRCRNKVMDMFPRIVDEDI